MSKSSFVKNLYVHCFVCGGDVLHDQVITTTIKGQLESGQKFQTLVVVCWFCTLDVKQPIPFCLSSTSNLNGKTKWASKLAGPGEERKTP